jgi:hypothetical protein
VFLGGRYLHRQGITDSVYNQKLLRAQNVLAINKLLLVNLLIHLPQL